MLGPYGYAVWLACTFLEAAVVVCALKRGAFRRYFLLNFYMAASVAASISRYNILSHYGFSSTEYIYFYYYSDALLTILLYLALSSLYSHIFSELKADRYFRAGTVLLLSGTALFSYFVVEQSASRLMTRFVVELSQNLYFVGLVLTYVLWAAILKMRETRARLVQLVLSLGVYFSLFAANYAMQNLYRTQGSFFESLTPLFGCFLPLAWAHAFWNLPEEASLAPRQLVMVPR